MGVGRGHKNPLKWRFVCHARGQGDQETVFEDCVDSIPPDALKLREVWPNRREFGTPTARSWSEGERLAT